MAAALRGCTEEIWVQRSSVNVTLERIWLEEGWLYEPGQLTDIGWKIRMCKTLLKYHFFSVQALITGSEPPPYHMLREGLGDYMVQFLKPEIQHQARMLPRKNPKVLDLGGGDGTLLEIMKQYEPSMQPILWDKDCSTAQDKGLYCIQEPFDRKVYGYEKIVNNLDLIVMSEVIHLMPPTTWCGHLVKFGKYLKPGGHVLIIDVEQNTLLQWRLEQFSSQEPMLATSDDICIEMEGIGFKCIYSNTVENHYFLRFGRN